nr:MAG TPA: hypothetical protein [Caudoviricetes sp.]
MGEFKAGDIIKANEKSNGEYRVTNQKCGWMGEVIKVVDDNRIVVRTIAPRSDYGMEYGQYFPLESKYFDIVRDGAEVLNDLLDWLDGNTVRNPKQAVEQYMREKGYKINKEN